ncbi:lanthionine synthetase C family protein [Streptomyces yaizuensis]|uniref:Lanthionine synthetase C family protein n=1 Tax=Streptomyces yaizuensis TaxID=2989713 RepID=A0ABQ5P9L2_9ACTN|nr:lanthionine synthetase C family protein [Streptomyces sp. YSPA8]GLF99271.1 lanthionine synthetase C family protein [Streptomyces sp. YSPA8]
MNPRLAATDLIEHLTERLAAPEPPPPDKPWAAQSLSHGAAGTALLHIERAHSGTGTWRQAHRWIANATAGEVSATETSGLYWGVPAVAFMLHAAAGSSERYGHALAAIDRSVTALAHRRTAAALDRIRRGGLPAFREYDLFSGLTGIGAYLLRRNPGGTAVEGVLTYLVSLTRPLLHEGQAVPGWWVGHDQYTRTSARFPHGHSNQGVAHGITGPLLLLAQATRRGITVDDQPEAIASIQAWCDRWRQTGGTGAWWPECVSLADLRAGRPSQPGPARPSWCYGTPGIARALQLAAVATHDIDLQSRAEQHLIDCLSDPTQLTRLNDAGLCHGWAGIHQTVWRAAQDATTPALREALPPLTAALVRAAGTRTTPDPGFLNGEAGTALALTTGARDTAPLCGWDACLLID